VAGGLVAAVEVDRWVAERGESGDVGGVGVVTVGDEVVEGGLGVDGLPQHDDVEHDAEGVELVFLADLVVLAELATVAVEYVAGQAVSGFAAVEQVADGAAVLGVVAVLQDVQRFDDAAEFGQGTARLEGRRGGRGSGAGRRPTCARLQRPAVSPMPCSGPAPPVS
jgi:hypothetical protein